MACSEIASLPLKRSCRKAWRPKTVHIVATFSRMRLSRPLGNIVRGLPYIVRKTRTNAGLTNDGQSASLRGNQVVELAGFTQSGESTTNECSAIDSPRDMICVCTYLAGSMYASGLLRIGTSFAAHRDQMHLLLSRQVFKSHRVSLGGTVVPRLSLSCARKSIKESCSINFP